MENKKDLAKIALAALILASATPVNGQADNGVETHETFLAVGCSAHGCPAVTNGSANNTTNNSNSYYNPHASNPSNTSSQPYGTQNKPIANPNAGGYVDYSETYNGAGAPPSQYRGSNPNSNNREYIKESPTDYNHAAAATSNSSVTLTEAQLLGMLDAQGRAIYLSLDSEGKALAIQLASQESYRDKNLALKEAQRRMNERRSQLNR